MRLPAEQARRPRTVIQWTDEGTAARVPHFLSDDAPPYRALGFAALLGIVSIVAVVAAFQFQRQGGFPDVGPLVEQARASTTIDQTDGNALMAASADAKPSATATGLAGTQSAERSAKPAPLAREAAPEPSVQAAAAPSEQTETIGPIALAVDPSPLETADPRWSAAQTPPVIVSNEAEERPAEPGLMALVPEEKPIKVPTPIAAPRQDATQVAAVAVTPKRMAEKVDVGLASAQVRSAVFLRARPADGAKVLVTVPRGAKVQIASNCRHWCSVTYQGKTGFIYKSFLSR